MAVFSLGGKRYRINGAPTVVTADRRDNRIEQPVTKSIGDARNADEPVTRVSEDSAADDHSANQSVIRDADGNTWIDPNSVSSSGSGDTPAGEPKRRGRPRGSRNRTSGDGFAGGSNASGDRKQGRTSKSTQAITDLLFTTHAMLSGMMGVEEIKLDIDEAKMLAEATKRVTDLYEIPLLDEKSQAWIGLALCMGRVYGPRVVAVTVKQKRQSKPKVVNMQSNFGG